MNKVVEPVATATLKEELTIADYEEVLADHRRLVRRLDVALNGEGGAAHQASLCDIVGQVEAGWLPIATAPRAKAVLVFKSNTKEQYVAALIDGGHGPGWCDQSGCELFKVTHWRPLHPNPSSSDATRSGS